MSAKDRTAEYAQRKTTQDARIAEGLCPRCGESPPLPDRRCCAVCMEQDRRIGRAVYHDDVKNHICPGCRTWPPKPGRTYCEECTRNNADRMGGTRHRRLMAGKCVRCGKRPPAPANQLCEPCRADRSAYMKALRLRKKEAKEGLDNGDETCHDERVC